jgi:soluble lytic murein transglycosylase
MTVAFAAVGPVPRALGQEAVRGREDRTVPSALDSLRALHEGLAARAFAYTSARDLARRLSVEPQASSPELVLLAAQAHADARSWPAVRRLLSGRDWTDPGLMREARVLMGRAAMALGSPGEAVAEFEAAGVENLPIDRGVEYARALRLGGRPDDAARRFESLAGADPGIRGWLLLSAVEAWAEAGEPDSALKAAAGLRRRTEVWRDSTFSELVRAYFAAGQPSRGLSLADSLSRRAKALLAGQWLVPGLLALGDSTRAMREAESALRYRGIGPEVSDYLAAVDSSPRMLRRLASAELTEGRAGRAAGLLRRAAARVPGADRAEVALELAQALFADRQYSALPGVLDPWIRASPEPDTRTVQQMRFLAGRALYRRGLRGEASAVWTVVAADPSAPDGSYAGYLLADMQHDQGNLARARVAYEEVVARFPRDSWAGQSLMRLGMIDLVEERPGAAVEHFDTYRGRFPGGNWYQAATFWAARARDAAGDSSSARVLYRQVIGNDPIDYYGIQAARTLGEEPWDNLRLRPTPPAALRADHAELIARMQRLRDLGWKGRALRELAARSGPRESREDRLALAVALNGAGFSWQGTSIAWGVYQARSGIWSEDLLKAVYPLVYEPVLRDRADAEKLDPALVAALVRRESQFDRDVVSGAGATGLMQVMPATGSEVARRAGMTDFSIGQLVVPEVNLILGTRYLRELLERRAGAVVPALMSYNAGPHRYTAWRRFPEFSASTELMIDRIPFTETRRYVKAILAYRYIYSRLYDWPRESG